MYRTLFLRSRGAHKIVYTRIIQEEEKDEKDDEEVEDPQDTAAGVLVVSVDTYTLYARIIHRGGNDFHARSSMAIPIYIYRYRYIQTT